MKNTGKNLKPFYGLPVDTGSMLFFLGFSLVYIVLAAVHFRSLVLKPPADLV